MIEVDPRGVELPKFGGEVAMQLAEFGADMVRARYAREHPGATEAEIEAAVDAWWVARPSAPFGDADGVARVA